MNFIRFVKNIHILFIIVLISACNLPSYRHRNLEVKILQPENNNLIFLGSEVRVYGGSYAPEGGTNQTSRFLFFANGARIGELPASPGVDTSARQAVIRWSPTAAGEYQIQTEAIVNDPKDDRGGISTGVRVCVLDLPFDTILEAIPLASYTRGYSGPCLLPPPNPTNPNDNSFNFVVGTNASLFAYPTDACPSLDSPVVNFTATVDRDPSDQLALILVDITWGGGLGIPVALSLSGREPSGEKIYTGSLSFEDILGVDYVGSPITWTAFASARNGSLLGRVTGIIEMRPCTLSAGKPEDNPTQTITPGSVPPTKQKNEDPAPAEPAPVEPAPQVCPPCNPGQDQIPFPNCSCIG